MTPSDDDLARFAGVVSARLGLRVDAERAGEVIGRRAAARRESFALYLDRLDRHDLADPVEIGALVGELTVGETYFFRHIEQFRAFADVAVAGRLAHGRLRVLSIGCSSGEEPYTLAMLLRESHPHNAFAIHAIDLNASSIARARLGRYSRWSLRATAAELEQRWFQPDGREVVIAPELRAAVTFESGNVLDDGVLGTPERWDVVFCRNMIMYFTDDRADAVIARIARALAPGGYLFLGHAETLRDRTDEFALCHTHGAFYYQRSPAASSASIANTAATNPGLPSGPSELDAGWYEDIHAAAQRVHAMIDGALDRAPGAGSDEPPGRRSTSVPLAHPPADTGPAAPDLAAIRELFAQERFAEAVEQLEQLRTTSPRDREIATLRALVLTHSGRFAEARSACSDLLAIDPASAGANYLLALCCDSTGDTDGAAHLAQVAAELDPSFAMPRVHLGLLARRTGARAMAERELAHAIVLLEREVPARLQLYGSGFSRQALLGMCRAELAAIGASR
jgi:chemotaxis protein methyltransferase CheR